MYPLVDHELTFGQIAHQASIYPARTDSDARRRFLLRSILAGKFDFAFPASEPVSARAVRLIAGTNNHRLIAFRDPQSRKLHRDIIEASGDPYSHYSLEPNPFIGHEAFDDDVWEYEFPFAPEMQTTQTLETLRQELADRLPPLEAFDEYCLDMIFGIRISKPAYLSFCLQNNYQDYQFWHHGPISVRDTSQWVDADLLMQSIAHGPRMTKSEAIEAMQRIARNLSARELNEIWSLRAPPAWRRPGRRRGTNQ